MFSILSEWIQGPSLFALLAAFVWGVLSILLSPCHLTSIPLIIGFIGSHDRMSVRRAFAASFLFAFGILLTIGVIGGITAWAGRLAGDLGGIVNYIVAILLFAMGLVLLDVLRLPAGISLQSRERRRGLPAAFVMGLVFGIALGPCTFAFMAPVLGVAFKAGSGDWLYAVLLIMAYGVGHCSVIVLAGTFTQWVQRYLDWNERSRGTGILRKLCGVLLIAGGMYLIYAA